MWSEATLKCFYGIAKNVAYGDVRGGSILRPFQPFIHGVLLAAFTHSRLHQRHVLVAIVVVVELSPVGVRIHHGNLYHSFLQIESYTEIHRCRRSASL